MPKASIRPPIVLAFLGHRDEQLARPAVGVQADGDVALVAGDVELVGDRLPRVGQALAARLGGDGGAAAAAFWPSLLVFSGWLSFEPSR